MSTIEITNLHYNEFLTDLKVQGKIENYEIAKQHPDKWNGKPYAYGEPFIKNHPTHPAYDDYPILPFPKKVLNYIVNG